MNNKVAGD